MEKRIDDIFLLQQIKNDDEAVFKFFFETHFTSIYRFVFLYIKEKAVVEEIALDVFTTFWEKRKTIEIRLSLKAYLFQSARNRAINYIRDNQQSKMIDDIAFFDSFEEHDSLEIRELENLIEEAVCSLPEKCREVFRKSRMENLTHKEIASQMNITTKTVEGQITKALKHIKYYLGDAYHYLW